MRVSNNLAIEFAVIFIQVHLGYLCQIYIGKVSLWVLVYDSGWYHRFQRIKIIRTFNFEVKWPTFSKKL